MIRFGIAEVLKTVSDETDYSKKIEILRKNDSTVLRHLLRLTFTPGVQWLLPEGKPPIKYNDLPGQQGNLFSEWRRFYLFFPGGNDRITQTKRETLFIQILESLDPKDADLICNIKDGIMPYASVTADLVNDAFPGLLPLKTKEVKIEINEENKELLNDKTKLSETLILNEENIENITDSDLALMENITGAKITLKKPEVSETKTSKPTTKKTTKKKSSTSKDTENK